VENFNCGWLQGVVRGRALAAASGIPALGMRATRRYNFGMTSEHFDRTFRAFQKRAPFKVFTVELVSGQRFQVDHPEALVLRDGVAVFVAKGGVPVLFDHEGVSQVLGEAMQQSA
jgi:hypothetical protein